MSFIDEKKLVTEAYRPIAMDFNDTRYEPWDWQRKFLNEIGDGFYYDIGCGGGRLLNNNSIGIDTCDEFIDIVRLKGLSCVKADMTQIPFRDESADAIICIASFHHLSTKERRIIALNEMYRVLKSTGKMLISIWSKIQPNDKKGKHKFPNYGDVIVPWFNKQKLKLCDRYYYIFEESEIRALFELIGFKIISYEWNYGNDIYVLGK